MSDELQQLLDKIQRDGVAKAKSQADEILAAAQAQAKTIVETAKAEADKAKAAAAEESAAFEHRAEETIRQAARDTVLKVEQAVGQYLDALLLKDVNAAMNDSSLVPALCAEAVRAYLDGKGEIEVASSAKLADALRAQLAAQAASGVMVTTDADTGAGFSVKLDNGRVEHSFTGAAVADALARQLRPRLAALLK